MSEREAQIREDYPRWKSAFYALDMNYLLTEIDRLRAENERLQAHMSNMIELGKGLRDAELGRAIPFEVVESGEPFEFILKKDLGELRESVDRLTKERDALQAQLRLVDIDPDDPRYDIAPEHISELNADFEEWKSERLRAQGSPTDTEQCWMTCKFCGAACRIRCGRVEGPV